MGARKRISAEKRKEANKTQYFAKLNNVPTSPRKMRLVADMIRGMEVNKALSILKFSPKELPEDWKSCLDLQFPIGSRKQNKKQIALICM